MRLQNETSEKLLCVLNSEGFECKVYQYFPTLRVEFIADGDIDADGAFRAYHPNNTPGLDALSNAGHPGNWFGIETDRNGNPFIQGPSDPAPGFYVSGTAYEWPTFPKNNPRRFVDSETVPFIVVENYIRKRAQGTVLGCTARVTNIENRKSVDCVVADFGPLTKLGELSIAAAKAVGLDSNARHGGTDKPILKYELWPGSPGIVNNVTYKLIPAIAA